MNKLSSFFAQFKKRGGIEVLFSAFGTKVISLIVSIMIARTLPTQEFGLISYALMIISPLIPLAGLGMDLVLLRYGALSKFKNKLLNYTLKLGIIYSFIIVCFIFVFADVISVEHIDSAFFIKLISIILVLDFLVRTIQNYLRITEQNRMFALTGIVRSIGLLITSIILVHYYSAFGYSLALLASPLIVVVLFAKKIPFGKNNFEYGSFEFSKRELHKYGILIGLGAVISQLQLPLAGILLGQIGGDAESLAIYKVASIIPVSLLFLPNIFFKSEFVHLTKNYESKSLIKEYIVNYWTLALSICLALCMFSFLFADYFIPFIFGDKYAEASPVFNVLLVGICGGFLLRQPFGNLTFAAGRADINTILSVISLLLSLIVISFFIHLNGVFGAAVGTAIMFWLSGSFNAACYYYFIYKKLL